MGNITTQPEIETERFVLRPVRKSDEGPIEMYAGDPRVAMSTVSIPHPLPPGVIEAFITRAMAEERDEDVWVMDGSKSGTSEVMGVITLT
ncbi:GNAT family N-acetyltransferase, partial [Sulfitobacter sp. HI0040]